jgi:ribose transport system permease protein
VRKLSRLADVAETVSGHGLGPEEAVRPVPLGTQRQFARHGAQSVLGKFGIVVVLLVLMVVGQILYSGFLDWSNVSNLLAQNASVGLVAIGMTFVILGEGFDLSVGGTYALASVLYAQISAGHSVALGALAAIGAGVAAGLINGAVVARVRVNPFVATLGSGFVFSGLAYIYSKSAPISVDKPGFQWLGSAGLGGVPVSIWAFAAVALVSAGILARTVYGRNVYAVGGNLEACRLAGIRVGMVRGSTYVLTGALAAIGGIMITGETGVGQANVGGNLALDAIAMVIIGGTSLSGGDGAIWRTVVGFLVLAGVTNLLDSLGVGSNWQSVATGAILVGAVTVDVISGRLSVTRVFKQ